MSGWEGGLFVYTKQTANELEDCKVLDFLVLLYHDKSTRKALDIDGQEDYFLTGSIPHDNFFTQNRYPFTQKNTNAITTKITIFPHLSAHCNNISTIITNDQPRTKNLTSPFVHPNHSNL
jgi:hypothetical protein